MIKKQFLMLLVMAVFGLNACKPKAPLATGLTAVDSTDLKVYAEVELTSNISHLSTNEKEMLKLMFQVAEIMEDLFWQEAYGTKDSLLSKISNPDLLQFAKVNYGPWDRLNDNKPFINGFGSKALGAGFYPQDMTKVEFDDLADSNKTSLYTMIRRNDKGALEVVWYHQYFKAEIEKAAALIKHAATLAEDSGLRNYLNLRAEALLTDQYQASDMAWMDMKNSNIDFVVGPIENYEDQLFGYKAAHEAFILVKDIEWSKKLAYYAQFLPKMQENLPVEAAYKREKPGQDVDINAYDVVYYAGDCDAGSKTIAINLPNDEYVQLNKGSRKLQLKNAMKAKFDKIMLPISQELIAPDQLKYVTFDAFFANVMFHEVAHGMGIKNTLDGKNQVRTALKEQYSAIEEGKADILGLFIITQLIEMGEIDSSKMMDNYVTFLAGIFRSIRFGAASAHGKANLMRFNFFLEKQAFMRNTNGTYSINLQKMKEASASLTADILRVQGDGNYEAAKAYVEKWTVMSPQLKADLDRLAKAGIPKDVYYKQGPKMLGL